MSSESSVDCRRPPFQSSGVLQAPSLKWIEGSLTLSVPRRSGWEKQQAREAAFVQKVTASMRMFIIVEELLALPLPKSSAFLQSGLRARQGGLGLFFSLFQFSFLLQTCRVGLNPHLTGLSSLVSDCVAVLSVIAGPVCGRETTSSCVRSPGNWRPFHICSPSRGREEITKTFQHGARARATEGKP